MQVRKVSPMNKLLIQIIYISLMLFGGVSCQTDTGTKEPTHNSIDNKLSQAIPATTKCWWKEQTPYLSKSYILALAR